MRWHPGNHARGSSFQIHVCPVKEKRNPPEQDSVLAFALFSGFVFFSFEHIREHARPLTMATAETGLWRVFARADQRTAGDGRGGVDLSRPVR